MRIGPKSKVALMVGLMLGQASPVDPYYEDDNDHNLTSAILTHGWKLGYQSSSRRDLLAP